MEKIGNTEFFFKGYSSAPDQEHDRELLFFRFWVLLDLDSFRFWLFLLEISAFSSFDESFSSFFLFQMLI